LIYFVGYTLISRSRHFEIESEAPVGRTLEVQIDNSALDYQPEAAAAIYTIGC
jgi:hypothetical protein